MTAPARASASGSTRTAPPRGRQAVPPTSVAHDGAAGPQRLLNDEAALPQTRLDDDIGLRRRTETSSRPPRSSDRQLLRARPLPRGLGSRAPRPPPPTKAGSSPFAARVRSTSAASRSRPMPFCGASLATVSSRRPAPARPTPSPRRGAPDPSACAAARGWRSRPASRHGVRRAPQIGTDGQDQIGARRDESPRRLPTARARRPPTVRAVKGHDQAGATWTASPQGQTGRGRPGAQAVGVDDVGAPSQTAQPGHDRGVAGEGLISRPPPRPAQVDSPGRRPGASTMTCRPARESSRAQSPRCAHSSRRPSRRPPGRAVAARTSQDPVTRRFPRIPRASNGPRTQRTPRPVPPSVGAGKASPFAIPVVPVVPVVPVTVPPGVMVCPPTRHRSADRSGGGGPPPCTRP